MMLDRGTRPCKSLSGIVSAEVLYVKAAGTATCSPERLADIIPAHFPCLSSVAVRHEKQDAILRAAISSLHHWIIGINA